MFKKWADSIIQTREYQLRYSDSLRMVDRLIIDQYENVSIPALESRIRVKDSINRNQERGHILQIAVKDAEIKEQKQKKWKFGFWGYILGIASAIASYFVFGL